MPDLLLSADQVVTPARVFAPGWLRVSGGTVAEVAPGLPPRAPDHVLRGTVAPGFVDVHVHGGGGRSFDSGDPDDAAAVVAAHRAHGTTTMAASLVTGSTGRLERSLKELGALVDDGVLAGLHLEGPWLSPRHAGAHDPGLLAHPAPESVDRLLAAADGRLRMVTLAPELPGGLEAVRRLTEAGVLAAVGHTDADYDTARAALDAGAGAATHLFNAMRGLHHREPGPAPAMLEHPDAFVELVADGVHVHPAVAGLAARAAPHRLVLVTDAMAAAAAQDGDYRLGSMEVQVRDGVARLAGTGAIAGSTLTLARAVRYAVDVVGLPLADAVRAATATPAAMLGLGRVGVLRPGAAADLVVLDENLEVVRVMRRGQWV